MRYGPMMKSELGPLSTLLGDAFSFPAADAPRWLRTARHENVRVVREGARPVGCLVLIPMGQYFGGRSVPTVGIAGVGVGVADRGRGVARALMESTVREIAARRVALSTLYPATQTLYRAVGYERAGKLVEVTAPTHLFTAPRTTLVTRVLTKKDEAKTTDLYRAVAPSFHGYLDRGPYVWSRVRAPQGKPSLGVGFFSPARRGALEAYVHFVQARDEPGAPFHVVTIKDVCARSPEGYDAVVRFLGEQRSLGRDVRFRAGPSSPLLMKVAEPHYREESLEDWMVRVTHVKSALEARGYPSLLEAELDLEVSDPLVRENAGRLVLTVRGGRGRVAKGGRGTLSIDVRALAPLYTGYLSATQLARLGLAAGAPDALALADALFAAPMPSMCEMF